MDLTQLVEELSKCPELPPTQLGDCRSDPPIPGGMRVNDDLAEGLRWVLSIEEGICLESRFSISVLEKGLFLSR